MLPLLVKLLLLLLRRRRRRRRHKLRKWRLLLPLPRLIGSRRCCKCKIRIALGKKGLDHGQLS